MAAGKYSFVIEQGTTVNFEIQYKDSNGNPTTPANVVDTVAYPDIWVGTPPTRTVKISPRTL